jgi:hypothetical protein
MEETREQRQAREKREIRRNRCIALAFLCLVVALVMSIVRGNRAEEALRRATAPHFNMERMCGVAEKDLFDATIEDVGGKQFRSTPTEGCWTKLVLPHFTNNWRIYTAQRQKPGDWVAVRCLDGRLSFPPAPPDLNKTWGQCGGDTPKERETYLFQGNVELLFKAE